MGRCVVLCLEEIIQRCNFSHRPNTVSYPTTDRIMDTHDKVSSNCPAFTGAGLAHGTDIARLRTVGRKEIDVLQFVVSKQNNVEQPVVLNSQHPLILLRLFFLKPNEKRFQHTADGGLEPSRDFIKCPFGVDRGLCLDKQIERSSGDACNRSNGIVGDMNFKTNPRSLSSPAVNLESAAMMLPLSVRATITSVARHSLTKHKTSKTAARYFTGAALSSEKARLIRG
jgi:hypothetical protein